jgi:hypothetical protein
MCVKKAEFEGVDWINLARIWYSCGLRDTVRNTQHNNTFRCSFYAIFSLSLSGPNIINSLFSNTLSVCFID